MDDELLTLSGIAELAGVQRPVVTLWRSRTRVGGRDVPFPVGRSRGGVEHFARAEVEAYLVATGRGNNPQFRDDAIAHVELPATHHARPEAIAAATALVALKAASGESLRGLDTDSLLDLADSFDPDDSFLSTELSAVGPDLPVLAAYVEGLVDAAYDTAGAHARLRALERAVPAGVTGATRALAGRLGADLALSLSADRIVLVDPDGYGGDLLAATLATLAERLEVSVHVHGAGPPARAARRRWVAEGVPHDELEGDTIAVALADFPDARRPAEMLARLEDLMLDLTDEQPLIVTGPAAVLCDSLDDRDAEGLRDDVARGRLRTALRLPVGQRPSRPRERTGLWVLGAGHAGRVSERRIAVADLSAADLVEERLEAVSSDVLASLRLGSSRARAFTALRSMPLGDLLAEGRLVPRGMHVHREPMDSSAEAVIRLRALVAGVATCAPGVGTLTVEAPRASSGIDPCSGSLEILDDLAARRAIAITRGTRVDSDLLRPDAPVSVYTVADIEERRHPSAGLGTLEAATAYPRARRTAPGDVVFATRPRPCAVVDRDGGAIVASPARVIRPVRDSGVCPEVVAATINALPPEADDWRVWRLPVVANERVGDSLDGALAQMATSAGAQRSSLTTSTHWRRRPPAAGRGGAWS